jgi:Fe-S oxidoreductase
MTTSLAGAIDLFEEQLDASVRAYLSSCVNCGLCAEACLFYTETGDPRYTPIYKLEPLRRVWRRNHTLLGRLAALVGRGESIDDDTLDEWEPLIYDGCTLCGRCSMVCPMGNDIAYMIRKEREAMVAAGHAPKDLENAARRTIEKGSPMGVTLHTLKSQIAHIERETGVEIPLDIPGVDYMAILSSMEIMNYAEYIEGIARIFKAAGVSWTLSSEAYEATNAGIQLGDSRVAAELVERIVRAAEQLGVKAVISPECGHAYTAIRWEGPNLIGRPYSFEVLHILELLDQLHRDGRLNTTGTTNEPLTFHDPCQLVRRGGVVAQPQDLLSTVAENVVEMKSHGVMNWCCGGGGGVSAIERSQPLRAKVFECKKRQLEQCNVDLLVCPCANCRTTIEDGLEENEMDIEVIGLTELIASYLDTTEAPDGRAARVE